MKEVKNPQRPMAFYYGIALLVILLFNSMAKPYMEEAKIEQVDYGTFMSMTEEKKVTKADIQDNQILFTDADSSTAGALPEEEAWHSNSPESCVHGTA